MLDLLPADQCSKNRLQSYQGGKVVVNKLLSRRAFLQASKKAAHSSAIMLTMPMILSACNRAEQARLSGESYQILSEEEANEFNAIAARIIPSDETPGALEAGVIYFIDNVMNDDMLGRDEELLELRNGLRELQTAVALNYGGTYFYQLETSQQDQLLTEIEISTFFGNMRFLTLAGMFSLPEYGGNRDNTGYQLIGYQPQGAWAAPYGFYDADFMEKGE